MNGREALRAFEKGGVEFVRQQGSHVMLWNPVTGRGVAVPVHGGEDLRPGALRTIIREAGLTVEQFCELLK